MAKVLATLCSIAFVLGALAFPMPANAGAEWCEEDPVYAANGNVIDATTTFDSA